MNVGETAVAGEGLIRLGVFALVLVTMMLWEVLAPKRALRFSRRRRWPGNFGVLVLNSVLLRLVFPTAAVGIALFAADQRWGLFNLLELPLWLSVIICVIALDLAIYFQHVLFHSVPALWRLHRMHHADLDFDVSTGGRFHPVEIILSMLIKLCVIIVLGAPALSVLVFELLLSSTSLFNHGNVHMPPAIDRVVRWFVVTPDMHRLHHSVLEHETNSNFGFNLPWWDRLLGTYAAQPRDGHLQMDIGIRTFSEPQQCQDLRGMLVIPFIGGSAGYAINRRSWQARGEPGDTEHKK